MPVGSVASVGESFLSRRQDTILAMTVFEFTERRHAPNAASVLYLLPAELLISFLVLATLTTPAMTSNASMLLVCGVLRLIAMGVQNARGKLLQASGLPNTVMAGNVTRVVLYVINRFTVARRTHMASRSTNGSNGFWRPCVALRPAPSSARSLI